MIHDLGNVAQLVFVQFDQPQSVVFERVGNCLDSCRFSRAGISGEEDVGGVFSCKECLGILYHNATFPFVSHHLFQRNGVRILHRNQLAACSDGEHVVPCIDAVAVLGNLRYTLGVEFVQIGLVGLPCRQGNAGLHLCLNHGRGEHCNAVQQFQFCVQAGFHVLRNGFAGTGTLDINVFVFQNDLFQIAGEVVCPFIQSGNHGTVKADLCGGIFLVGVAELHQCTKHRILL